MTDHGKREPTRRLDQMMRQLAYDLDQTAPSDTTDLRKSYPDLADLIEDVRQAAALSPAPAASRGGEPSNETLYRLHMVCLNAEASMREGAERLRQQLAEMFPDAGAAATSFPLLSAAALDSPTTCRVPPPGWYCTRAAGHEGPCAARPVGGAAQQGATT